LLRTRRRDQNQADANRQEPLVGRRDEMTALEDDFARAAAGEFRVVLLSGERRAMSSGIWSTALVSSTVWVITR
jgi:hypothetical protein